MKEKKIPLRRCVVTKERLPKGQLIRIVRSKDGKVSIDLTGKASGRGAYLKKDELVFNKAKQGKILDKVLEVAIDETIFEELKKLL
ncbi:MAG: YlxR family protein [Bacilli bacterium]